MEEKVEELYINNISINTISNITKKPKSSVYNAIYWIKDKKRNINNKSLNLNKTKTGPIKKFKIKKKGLLIETL